MKLPTSATHRKSAFGKSMLTPMIDVVFLLLIFFVCASSGQLREAILPSVFETGSTSIAAQPVEPKKDVKELWIEIRRSAENPESFVYVVNGNPLESNGLKATLELVAKSEIDPIVILKPAGDVTSQAIVDVIDVCEATGFPDVNFASPSQGGKK